LAVELLPPDRAVPTEPEWHRLRREGISASEIAAVLGISKWDSPFSLYWSKANDWRQEQSDEMSIGAAVEQAVADLWADRCDPHENLTLARAGLYAAASGSWQLATPDRLVHQACPSCGSGSRPPESFGCWDCRNTGCAGPPDAVLECKWAGTWDGWGDDGTDDIPVYYRAQALWQCHVLGVDQWYLGVLGPSGFRTYDGAIDPADIKLMVEHGRRFMDRLNRLDPPDIDDGHPATITTLKQLHPSIAHDDPIEVGHQFADGWRRARRLKDRAAAVCARYEARARGLLGDGRRLTLGGRLVASRSVYDRKPYEVGPTTIDKLNPGKVLTNG
jgi:putative phage-type endonuclease